MGDKPNGKAVGSKPKDRGFDSLIPHLIFISDLNQDFFAPNDLRVSVYNVCYVPYLYEALPYGLVVMIPVFQAGGPGSIPGREITFANVISTPIL